ncbi:riboflavin synthase [Pseudooceanicola sp. CBS1P-1]|uniref:Riboflavin synthase n=1 Tax=Pseudooceanicola albus TaxID=2692189 RepID=A0A6L7FY57_9RHOB|nr:MULTISPECIES: riboflavin synthase [Pseudooceanicola]MBT9383458.1 riboflavin synthase [Pseudooceanicola endophyticus]MXN16220.1 riboflavin synthase [Pseudooceanicola albus]
MFTGIITDIGTVTALETRGVLRAQIACGYDTAGIALGTSIACAGVRLTVTGLSAAGFAVEVSAETLKRSTLGAWTVGCRVNLERALRVGDELGGHIVSGHVDGMAEVLALTPEGESTRIRLRAPQGLARFIASKGSVALDGVSVTVAAVEGDQFDVNFIPRTKAVTTWGQVHPGDRVNLEVDTMARYLARLQDMAG